MNPIKRTSSTDASVPKQSLSLQRSQSQGSRPIAQLEEITSANTAKTEQKARATSVSVTLSDHPISVEKSAHREDSIGNLRTQTTCITSKIAHSTHIFSSASQERKDGLHVGFIPSDDDSLVVLTQTATVSNTIGQQILTGRPMMGSTLRMHSPLFVSAKVRIPRSNAGSPSDIERLHRSNEMTGSNRRICKSALGTIKETIFDCVPPLATVPPNVHLPLPASVASLDSNEIVDVIEDIGQHLDEIIEKSTKGPISQASIIVDRLAVILVQLIEEYRRLQEEAPQDIEDRINALFSKYQFSTVRNYFWKLFALSDIHCHKEKRESLSCLVKCLEIDPIHATSAPGLLDLLADVTQYLESLYKQSINASQQQEDIEITTTLLRIIALISEIYAWYNETSQRLTIDKGLVERVGSVLKTMQDQLPYSHEEARTFINLDFQLHMHIAKESLKNFITDRTKMQTFLNVVSPLVKGCKKLESDRNIVKVLEGLFSTVGIGFKAAKELSHDRWYIYLFGVRKGMRQLIRNIDKLNLLQGSLCGIGRGFTWEFVGALLHHIGDLALESQSQDLKFQACVGKTIGAFKSQPEELPLVSFTHFRYETPGSVEGWKQMLDLQSTVDLRKKYFSQLSQFYVNKISQQITDKKAKRLMLACDAFMQVAQSKRSSFSSKTASAMPLHSSSTQPGEKNKVAAASAETTRTVTPAEARLTSTDAPAIALTAASTDSNSESIPKAVRAVTTALASTASSLLH